jgi:hypothetical protein
MNMVSTNIKNVNAWLYFHIYIWNFN